MHARELIPICELDRHAVVGRFHVRDLQRCGAADFQRTIARSNPILHRRSGSYANRNFVNVAVAHPQGIVTRRQSFDDEKPALDTHLFPVIDGECSRPQFEQGDFPLEPIRGQEAEKIHVLRAVRWKRNFHRITRFRVDRIRQDGTVFSERPLTGLGRRREGDAIVTDAIFHVSQ